MYNKNLLFLCLSIGLVSAAILVIAGFQSIPVSAQEVIPLQDQGTCMTCHEDLYFLHDTGNWFCIREAPMQCVDCHGGDPSSLKQDEAHASREAHPVINEDVSRCQECHPAECDERVKKFDQVAGISNVLVAISYQPSPIAHSEQSQQVQPDDSVEYPGWLAALEVITPILISGLVLVIYLIHHKRHSKIKNRSLK